MSRKRPCDETYMVDDILKQPTPTAPTDLARRVVGLLNLYRLLIPPTLLLISYLTEPQSTVGSAHPTLFLSTCALYFLFGIGLVLAQRLTWPNLRVLALTHGVIDGLTLSLLLFTSGGVASGQGILLVLPVGATALLAEKRDSFLIAAAASLAMLVQQIVGHATGTSSALDYPSAGVLGAVIFLIAFGAAPLANRLRESEALVKRQEIDLANLAQVSQFIVQHLRESILVVDEADKLRLINESAAHLLGDKLAFPGALLGEASPRLLYLLTTWRSAQGKVDLVGATFTSEDGSHVIEPHFAPLGSANPGPVLIFLEDTSLLASRVQQSKLASLGRLSASIAHEIRNPVGAMSHAGQLLGESAHLSEEDRKLTQIIRRNADRVSSIISNVLQMSRRDASRPQRLLLGEWLGTFRDEFCATMQWSAEKLSIEAVDGNMEIRADPSQLRQVLWNLCDNAMKYGMREAAAIRPGDRIEIRYGRLRATARPFLEVLDRGAGIRSDQVERIFEPFFSGEQRSSGLGLFLARELAQTNSATLLYEARAGGGSVFRLVFSDPLRWEV